MKNILFLSLLAMSFGMVSCKKNVSEQDEPATAVLLINTPVENQVFNYGDTVRIDGTINADLAIHGYMVRLVNLSTGMNVLNQDYHVHQKDIVFHEAWRNTVSDTTQMKIILDAAIDHEGNLATLERIITCYPQ